MPTNLRILHIDTERGWRGGERQTLWLAAELARRGHTSFVAARSDEPLALRAAASGLRVMQCAPLFEGDPRAVLAVRKVIRRELIDVVHAHTAHAAGLGALATLGTPVPLVIARRVDFHLRANAGTRWKYGRAAAIVAVSRAVARILEGDGIPSERIVVVPDGTDVHRTIVPASTDVLTALGVPLGAPLVVQVAQLVGHKDPLNFVRAVAVATARVPGMHALLAGDGPLRPDVEREVAALGLAGRLHVLGYRTDADALLAAADVAVLSSREEGMGSVLIDALLLGRPIVATTAGGIPEIIEHGVSGLLAPPGDSAALGLHIAALLDDTVLATRVATGARARAPEFSVERMADRTLAVYERVLAAARASEATRARSSSATRAP